MLRVTFAAVAVVAVAAAALRASGGTLQVLDDYRVLGSGDAPAELVIFSDFECPYCRNFALAAMPAIVAEFVDTGQLRLRYVFFPLAALHENAVAAAKAAHCAGEAGHFWAYHDYLFVRQPEWSGDEASDSLWVAFARNLDLDPESFQRCFRSAQTDAAVEADLRMALAAGITSTPTVVLNGESVSGFRTYEQLRHRILQSIEASRP